MQLQALPAFDDNYIWMLSDARDAWVIDPGQASVVEQALIHQGLSLAGMLITHHHGDHVGGVAQLLAAYPHAVIHAPRNPRYDFAHQVVEQGDTVTVLGCPFEVMEIPGHTLDHVAYVAQPQGQAPLLFCGDTLFYGGCGRVFEGTPEQMWASLQQLAALPSATRVCCAHEYTLANLRFALSVEPNNLNLQAAEQQCQVSRARGLPTLPTTIGHERDINPFLRCDQASVRSAARHHLADTAIPDHDAAYFAVLREWKNNFR